MINPRGDTWVEGFQYFYSDGVTEIALDGIIFTFKLYIKYSEGAMPVQTFSTADYASIGPNLVGNPTSGTNSVLGWAVPSYMMAKLANAPASLDFRCVAAGDGITKTCMIGTMSLT